MFNIFKQYVDDASCILDGTEKSLKQTLLELKFYEKSSGLAVNADKTNVVWFGSKKGSDLRMCEEYKLHWENSCFSMLGIIMSTDLNAITQLNYEKKIKEMKAFSKAGQKEF